ncbi:MAG: alpha/beta hydrolase fold domain-containing protein [Dongiaceae bacterium]
MSARSVEARLDPAMRAALAETARLQGGRKIDWNDLPAMRKGYEAERRYWNGGGPELARIHDLAVAGPEGPIPLRCYRPTAAPALPALVYLHGGGYVLGSIATHDRVMRLLAEKSGAAVLGVEYRLAPEHRFPVQLEETAAVLDWLAREGPAQGLDPSRFALGGDSAGAHLALGTTLMRRAAPAQPKALILYYGAFGLADSRSMRLFGRNAAGLTRADMDFFYASYHGDGPRRADPRLDCLSADLAGLPPAFILAAELDPLLDDSLTLAALLEEAGVAHRLRRYDGVLHGFIHYSRAVPLAMRALDEGAAALRDWL